MSDTQQLKAGQRGKVLQFVAGIDMTGASVTVRLRGTDEILRTYAAVVSPTDPTVIELTVVSDMFDTPDTVMADYVVNMPDGRRLSPDENLAIEVIDL